MDDTQQSRTLDAAATRKRRSSILKLQRAPRAPFSELEFNVATPTDTSKSRRVSFSRRTGVAEFATNEATTTWKNFYEEHNKTLESSGNDSAVNPPRGSVGHISKRIFDEQFQEFEAVDFVSTLDNGRGGRNIETSLNTANFAEQLASLENTGDDRKLTAPQHNFELSAFTDHQSKVFGDDLAISCMGEVSDRLSVNFSVLQPIGDVKDDLDEMQRDLQSTKSHGVCRGPIVVCPGPFRGGKDLSEYIEVDLNMTNAALRNESDMSITDTIHSPKVENLCKINASTEKKSSLNQDWMADKENILVNPYVAPKESANFAINEEPEKVLIFDGKRLTIQSESEKIVTDTNYRKTLLPIAAPDPTPQRKTIVLNVNDDLPNFVGDPYASLSQGVSKGNHTVIDGDLSMTQAVESKVEINEKRRTIHYGDDTGNISITQALSGNILKPENEKRRTIVYESNSANISVTQALPSNIITSSHHNSIPDTTRTIVFTTESGDISVTQAISSKIIAPKKSDVLSEKRKTIVFEDDAGNISITQAIPSNIILPENEEVLLEGKTFVYDNDLGDISITQAVPTNFILTENESVPERRKTVVYEDDAGNISITQAIPSNILLPGVPPKAERRETIVFETDSGDVSVTEMIPSNLIDMSVTQAVPSNLILPERRKTIIHKSGSADISVTQAVHSNIILSEKQETIVRKSGSVDMSVTQAVPYNLILPERRKTIVYDSDSADMSVTQAVTSNLILPEKRKTIVNDSDSGEISLTQSCCSNQVDTLSEKRKTIVHEDSAGNISITRTVPANINTSVDNMRTIVFETNSGNISVTQAIPSNIILPEKRQSNIHEPVSADILNPQALPTLVSHIEKNILITDSNIISTTSQNTLLEVATEELNCADISLAESVEIKVKKPEEPIEENRDILLSKNIPFRNIEESVKRKTIVLDNEIGNMSITKPIPTNLISIEKDLLEKSKLNSMLNLKHDSHLTDFYETATLQQNVLVYQADTENSTMPKSKPIYSSFETMMGNSESKQAIINSSSSKENMKPGSSISARKIDSDVSRIDNKSKESVLDENNIMKPSSETSDRTIDSDMIITDSKLVLCEENNVKSASASIHRMTDTNSSLELTSKRDENSRKSVLDEGIITKCAPPTSGRTLDSDVCRAERKSKKSILDDLLDMSNASMTDGIDDKNVMVKLPSEHSQKSAAKSGTGDTSNDSLFFITKDSGDECQRSSLQQSADKLLRNQPLLHLEHKEEDSGGIVSDLQNKLLKLKAQVDDCNKSSTNRHFESVVSSDLHKGETKENKPNIKGYISFKEADSTKDLLEILSNFTDKEEEENPIEAVKASSEISVGNKVHIPEPKRLSFAPRRHSIVLSREDLLSNISMAQAVLQKSRVDVEYNDTIDDINDTTTEEKGTQAKKTVRMSNEVVKKLNFDEDSSCSDMSNKSNMISPLRKTAFGEESYMKENKVKANVIPTYLKDVSENIKELMNDLVKPMADVIPFESVGVDSRMNKVPSTCSLQVQANLIASSQIDLDPEPITNTVTIRDDAASQSSGILDVTKKTLQSALKTVTARFSGESSESNVEVGSERTYISSQLPGRVLVFDQNNPLNNVLLGPIDLADVHGYNPIKSNETLVASDNSGNSVSTKVTFKENEIEYDVGHITTECSRMTGVPVRYPVQKTGDANCEKISEVSSLVSNLSKRASTDQSIDAKVEVTDTEANTYIVMKGNKELLESSSSLTLVDDALVHDQFDVDIDTQSQADSLVEQKISPVRVIYKIDEDAAYMNKDSDVTSNDEEYQEVVQNVSKAKKRSYSPTTLPKHKHSTLSSLEVTPKPNIKMQRLLDSPVRTKPINSPASPERRSPKHVSGKVKSDLDQSAESGRKAEPKQSPKSRNKSPRSKTKKPGRTTTVQQLKTEYHMESSLDTKPISSEILESLQMEADMALRHTPQSHSDAESASSYGSSRCRSDIEEAQSMTTTESQSTSHRAKGLPMDWQPELLNELSSKNLVTECESSVNVVAKIDMLPFMGSRDCEWESRGGDAWAFRLLHGRLRLGVRLAHRHHDAPRSHVRADTRVLGTALDTLHHDKQNPVAVLCVRFAGEAMRCVVGRGVERAGDVPALLRRCAGVARVALRWGRALHDARARLAFSLSHTGHLALKVANIPLRSVWEVTMRLEMVVEDAREVPWPRAGEVRVAPVVAGARVSEEEVRRALAHLRRDWGHAPRAIWKIFRHLKNKTMDDDLLLGL